MRAYWGHRKGKNFVSKIYCYCPWFLKRFIHFSLSNLRVEYNLRAIFRTLPSNLNLPLISEEILIFQIWGYCLQKVNAKCPQISNEKDKFFFPLIKIFFSLFLKRIKSYFSKRQNSCFFIRNLRAFCIYFLQAIPSNLKD